MACDHLVKAPFTPRAGCQIPHYLLTTQLPPSPQLMLQISSPSFFFFLLDWQLVGRTAICTYLLGLNPIVNILIHNTQPFQRCELSFSEKLKRWVGEGDRLRQGFLGSSAKAHIVTELLFLLLASIWGGFSFGIKNRSQLAVCLLLSGQTKHSGRGWYHCVCRIFLAV